MISYGPDALDIVRRSASYVDRVLRGERPGELPVVRPLSLKAIRFNASRPARFAGAKRIRRVTYHSTCARVCVCDPIRSDVSGPGYQIQPDLWALIQGRDVFNLGCRDVC